MLEFDRDQEADGFRQLYGRPVASYVRWRTELVGREIAGGPGVLVTARFDCPGIYVGDQFELLHESMLAERVLVSGSLRYAQRKLLARVSSHLSSLDRYTLPSMIDISAGA